MKVSWCIFGRLPIPGKCKTRLAKTIGNDEAAELYCELLRHTLGEFEGREPILYSTDGTKEDFEELFLMHDFKSTYTLELQIGTTLGERMFNSLKAMQERSPVVGIVGSDIPTFSRHHIDRTEALLESCDLVVGPSQDGGFYLLATHKPIRELEGLFDGDNYSHDRVLENLLNSAQKLGLKVELLSIERDCDTAEDLPFLPDKFTI